MCTNCGTGTEFPFSQHKLLTAHTARSPILLTDCALSERQDEGLWEELLPD